MANTTVKASIDLDLKINLELSLEEAKVLNIITLWGEEAFFKVFTEKLGKTDLAANKKGLDSLFTTLKKNLPHRLKQCENIIKTVEELKK